MKRSFVFALLLMSSISATLVAQSMHAATETGPYISVGGELSTFNPDWGCTGNTPIYCWNHQLLGLAAVIDVNRVFGKFGAEGEARWLDLRGPGGGLKQSNYLIGPRYKFYSRGKLSAYTKIMLGGSWMTLPDELGNGSYFTIAPGGTVEYRLSRKLSVRGDYEYQFWPAFSGIPSEGNHGLTPNGFSVGFTYRLWH